MDDRRDVGVSMEEVNESGKEIVILKNGKPISELVPFKSCPWNLFGLHEGRVRSRDDLIERYWNEHFNV
ncbi:MAG: hypothetical protein JW925_14235 [Syntrophaceae bacterium]|nr:hypothetical protein [Syntrophaceae bacterium]